MKPPRQPLFLARETYRKRRLMDGARLLPVVGAFLFAIPVLWADAEQPGAETAREAVYVFTVWALLIVGAFALSRKLARGVDVADTGAADTVAADTVAGDTGAVVSGATGAGETGAGETGAGDEYRRAARGPTRPQGQDGR